MDLFEPSLTQKFPLSSPLSGKMRQSLVVCFMTFEQRDNEKDIKHIFINLFKHKSHLLSEQSFLVTCVGAENGTVLSLVTASVGFTMEGFPPGSLLPGWA